MFFPGTIPIPLIKNCACCRAAAKRFQPLLCIRGVASVFFFHIAINISMTIGLAPVIGIPLPVYQLWRYILANLLLIMLAILIRLDADRQMVLSVILLILL